MHLLFFAIFCNTTPKRYQNINMHLTEEPPEQFHEVAVSRDARGSYYCSFVYDDVKRQEDDERKTDKRWKKRKQHPLRDDGIVAFDLGVITSSSTRSGLCRSIRSSACLPSLTLSTP